MTRTMSRRPVGANVAAALEAMAQGRALDRYPETGFPRDGRDPRALDAFPPDARLDSLMGRCSIWTFSLFAANGTFLGGSANGLPFLKATGLNSESNPTGVLTPPAPAYSDQIAYFLTHPTYLRGIRFRGAGDAASVAYLQSLIVTPTAYSPKAGGYALTDDIPLNVLVSPYQQQGNIIDLLLNFKLTGYTYLNISAPAVTTADTTIQISLFTDKPVSLADALPDPGAVLEAIPGAPLPPMVGGRRPYNGRG